MKDFLKNKVYKNFYILIPILGFLLLRIPSFTERFWYDDEGIYAAMASGMRDGKILYSEVWDNKPPFIYWLYYLGDLVGWERGVVLINFFNLIAGLVSLILLIKIVQKFYNKNYVSLFAGLIGAFGLGSTMFEGNTSNAENFFVFLNVIILFLVYKIIISEKKPSIPVLSSIGFTTFLSFMVKTPGFIEAAVIVVTLFLIQIRQTADGGWQMTNGWKEFMKSLIWISLGFVVPFVIYLVYALLTQSFDDFVQIFTLNSAYSGAQNEWIIFLGIRLNPFFVKTVLLLATLLVTTIGYWRKEISKQNLLLANLIAIELYAINLSGRGYAHYFLQMVPGIVLLSGYFLDKIKKDNFFNNICNIFFLTISIHLILLTFTRGGELGIPMPPTKYYYRFGQDYILQREEKRFYFNNSNAYVNVTGIAKHINDNYKAYEDYYLYTDVPWVFALIEKPYTNKFVVYYQMTFGPEFAQEEVKNRNQASLFIVDERINKYPEFFVGLEKFSKVESFENYSIYRNIGNNYN